MYVVVQHRIIDRELAFSRGEKLIRNEDAPSGVRGLQFYPSTDGSAVVCLFEAPSVESVQSYVDSTLGEASENSCFEVNADLAYADRPSKIRDSAAVRA